MLRKPCLWLPTLGLIIVIRSFVPVAAEDWEQTCPPSCICKWYNNRKEAVCKNTGFSTIPSRLSSSIQVLDLTKNNIQDLVKNGFKRVNLVDLHVLVLAENRIEKVHKDAFQGLGLLMDLDLSNNRIEFLHKETFTGLQKMRKLILDGNLMSRLEAYQFPELHRLQHLLINNCRLNYLSTKAFANLLQLRSVGLRGNKLKVLNPDTFTVLPNLVSVALDDNQWDCDCALRRLVQWIQVDEKGEAELACNHPKRLAGKRFLSLDGRSDLACPPFVLIPRKEVAIGVGGNATLSCGARGTPPPIIQWILESRVLTNATELRLLPTQTEPHVKFVVLENTVGDVYWTNLTVIQLGEDFMLRDYDQSSPFRCKVENPAELIERNVTLVLGTVVESPITTGGGLDAYVILAVAAVSVLVVGFAVLVSVCLLRIKRVERPILKVNGGEKGAFLERNNIVIVNPIEKPPRKCDRYKKVPTVDVELTDLSNGTHRNFEEMNYPEERGGRVRSPLTPLEEEEFDQISQKLLNDSLTTTTTSLDYALQYPDLLDNLRFPRAVSPTELSYHSLSNPVYSPIPEWRYSYVYPSEFSPTRYTPTYGMAQPVSYFQRPGYVTLPRRPRTLSLNRAPHLGMVKKLEPIYDTLGPRTTADGTSRTDLANQLPRNLFESVFSSPFRRVESTLPVLPPLPYRSTLPQTPPLLGEQTTNTSVEGEKVIPPLINGLPSPDDSAKTAPEADLSVAKSNSLLSDEESLAILRQINDLLPESPVGGTKKVPPKLPPKPILGKRSSVSSNATDSTRISSLDYQDEGPDGTEV